MMDPESRMQINAASSGLTARLTPLDTRIPFRQMLHAWSRFQRCPFSSTQMPFGPCATVQVRPCHHNRHTIKRIYAPRCFKKIKKGMPPSWNLWLVSWAMSLHIWAAWGPWHNLHPTQTCLTPVICGGAVPEDFLWPCWRADTGTSNQEQTSYLSDSLHPPKCIQACPSDWSREGDRITAVRLNFSYEVPTPKLRYFESLWLLRWLNY